jgi:hypothetical protein
VERDGEAPDDEEANTVFVEQSEQLANILSERLHGPIIAAVGIVRVCPLEEAAGSRAVALTLRAAARDRRCGSANAGVVR